MKPRTLTLIAAMLLLALIWWLTLPVAESIPPPPLTDAERAYVRERHRYHGITASIRDRQTGERYFYRDGKRCKL
jgi:hypothetical protein